MSSRLKDEGLIRAMARFKNRRMARSKRESERDSGFSDGSSEHLSTTGQTNADDSLCSSSTSLTAMMSRALQSLSPVIIMNNVVLKQSAENPSLKPWAFSPAPQPQVVFLQPVVPQRPAPVQKGPPSKRRRHRKYLPILKSYPKIAPHPGDAPPKSSSSSSASSIKSASSPQKDSSAGSPAESHANAAQSADGFPRTLESNACSAETDDKIKRFCNMYNILSKSGLLDITLRTKELIRQNRRTQTELQRLRRHTDLFMQALQTGDSGVWSKLQTSMHEEHTGRERTPRDGESLQ